MDISDFQNKLIADMFRVDAEFLNVGPSNLSTSQTQSAISFSALMDEYAKLKLTLRQMYFVDTETACVNPDLLDSPDAFVMPAAYQEMKPKQWKKRKFHPPYRRPALRPQWVATPKGILAIDAPVWSMFR